MLLSARIKIENSPIRNIPAKQGAIIREGKLDEIIRIDSSEKKFQTWYHISGDGWIQSNYVEIIQDMEFTLKARKMKLMDIQRFGLFSGLSALSSDSNSVELGRDVGKSITTGGGCFGQSGSVGGLSSMVPNKVMDASLGTIFGVQMPKTSTLFDGTFFDKAVDSLLDNLFDKLFTRLNFVVGFDLASLLFNIYEISFPKIESPSVSTFSSTSAIITASSTNQSNSMSTLSISTGGSTGTFSNVQKAPYQVSSSSINPYMPEPGKVDFTTSVLKMEQYFNYLGSSSSGFMELHSGTRYTIWAGKSGVVSIQPSYYTDSTKTDFRTPILTDPNNDFDKSVFTLKDLLNLNIERQDWFYRFNRFRTTHPDYHLTNTMAHVFMTRPDLRIYSDRLNGKSISESISKSPDGAFFAQAIKTHPEVSKSLSAIFAGSHDFIPIIHNTAKSFDLSDDSIDTLDHGETLTKWKIVYGRDMNKSMTSGNFSISYIDDYKLSISYLHLIWLKYINGVSRGLFDPEESNIRDCVLDYASSCYYILTDATGENIIYWAKYWGVFPTNYPASTFSMRSGDAVKTPEISIQYAYAFKEEMDPVILAEFNRNSKGDGSFKYIPIARKENDIKVYRSFPTIVGAPFIDTIDSGITYKLRFRPPKSEDTKDAFTALKSISNINFNSVAAGMLTTV